MKEKNVMLREARRTDLSGRKSVVVRMKAKRRVDVRIPTFSTLVRDETPDWA